MEEHHVVLFGVADSFIQIMLTQVHPTSTTRGQSNLALIVAVVSQRQMGVRHVYSTKGPFSAHLEGNRTNVEGFQPADIPRHLCIQP